VVVAAEIHAEPPRHCVPPLHGRGIRSRTHRTQALFFKEGGTNEVSDGCFQTHNARPCKQITTKGDT